MITMTITITEIEPGKVVTVIAALGSATQLENSAGESLMAALQAHAENSIKANGSGFVYAHNKNQKVPNSEAAG